MSRRSDNYLVIGLVLVMCLALGWFFVQPGSDAGVPSTVATESSGGVSFDELELELDVSAPLIDSTISVSQLPVEAINTMYLIETDGPFPYSKDGSVFQNREGRLPDRSGGYYREYTVDTPGSPDRGARRIVGGDDGELFYTGDHYDSFSQITD